MAYQNQPGPFWDFVRSLDTTNRATGAGVDHPAEDIPAAPSGPHGESTFTGYGPTFPGFDMPAGPNEAPGAQAQAGFFGFPAGLDHMFGTPGGRGHFHGGRGGRGRRNRHGGPDEQGNYGEGHHGSRSRSHHDVEHSGDEKAEESGPEEGHPRHRGPRGPHGRHGHGRGGYGRGVPYEHENERSGDEKAEESGPDGAAGHRGPHGPHGRHGHGGWGARGGCAGFGGRGGWGGWGGHRARRFASQFGGAGACGANGEPFDLSAMIGALASHPIAQAFQTYAQQSGWGEHNNTGATRDANAQQTGVTTNDEENTFTPPLDIFSTPSSYVLHVAIPGAKKEDVGVNWDAEKSELNIAGVVYRQGDEDFLRSLSKSERKVGVFERTIKLPMGDEKEEVDAEGISAKLEDGVLVVTVMKVEKEWTDVKKVDIM